MIIDQGKIKKGKYNLSKLISQKDIERHFKTKENQLLQVS